MGLSRTAVVSLARFPSTTTQRKGTLEERTFQMFLKYRVDFKTRINFSNSNWKVSRIVGIIKYTIKSKKILSVASSGMDLEVLLANRYSQVSNVKLLGKRKRQNEDITGKE